MLDVDILSAFVISGAASCVAATMTVLTRADEPHVTSALRICGAGFAVLGLALVQVVFGAAGPTSLTMLVALTGSSLGLALFAWGLARMAGERVRPAAAAALLLGTAAAHLAAAAVGGWALSVTFVVAMTALSSLAVVSLRNFIRRPAGAAERILGLAMVGFAASWWLRLAWTMDYQGPLLTHHLHAPTAAARAFGILYGVMPIFLATVLLNVINARLHRQLALRALTDELTGAMTRRALHELAPDTIARARRAGQDVAVLMVDIDHFKAVNDRHGHLVGDDVLRQLVALLRAQLRHDALLTRFGGEEFAILAPVSGVAAARQAAERLRLAIAGQPFESSALRLQVTASIGLALLGPRELLDAALLRADEALYRAKGAGRDRVEASLEVAA